MEREVNPRPRANYYREAIDFVAVIIISIIDYVVVIDISLSILYLIPISVTSCYGNRRFSFFLVSISTISWFIAESAAKNHLPLFLLLWNSGVRLIVFLTISYLLSSLKRSYEKEKTLSQIDTLTGIANRRYFLESLQLESKRSLRYHRSLTLAYFDLDNFKTINDRLGHNTGDELLKLIALTVTHETMLEEADSLMYRVKKSGKDKIEHRIFRFLT